MEMLDAEMKKHEKLRVEILSKPFHIVAREWEDVEGHVMEDSVWDYPVYKISVDDIISALTKDPRVSVEADDEKIKIKDIASYDVFGRKEGVPEYFYLSGAIPDWHSGYVQLCKTAIVKKELETTLESGDVETFDKPRYVDCATFGLFKPDLEPVRNDEVIYCASIVSILSALQHERVDMRKVAWGVEREGW